MWPRLQTYVWPKKKIDLPTSIEINRIRSIIDVWTLLTKCIGKYIRYHAFIYRLPTVTLRQLCVMVGNLSGKCWTRSFSAQRRGTISYKSTVYIIILFFMWPPPVCLNKWFSFFLYLLKSKYQFLKFLSSCQFRLISEMAGPILTGLSLADSWCDKE